MRRSLVCIGFRGHTVGKCGAIGESGDRLSTQGREKTDEYAGSGA